MSAAILALTLSACGGGSGKTVDKLSAMQADIAVWKMGDEAQKAYPHMSLEKAKLRYANQKLFEAFRQYEAPEDKQLLAGLVYLGFAQLNTRARVAYCGNMNVDITGFSNALKRQHSGEERAIDIVLAHHGYTRDQIWEKQKRHAMASVKADLMAAGGHNGSYSACSALKKKPQKFVSQMHFSKRLPQASRQLKTAMKTKRS